MQLEAKRIVQNESTLTTDALRGIDSSARDGKEYMSDEDEPEEPEEVKEEEDPLVQDETAILQQIESINQRLKTRLSVEEELQLMRENNKLKDELLACKGSRKGTIYVIKLRKNRKPVYVGLTE